MFLLDSHLDLAWNAIEWGRDLRLEVEEIRDRETEMEGPGRGRNTVSIPELRRAEVGIFVGTILARKVVPDSDPPFVPFESDEESRLAALRQVEYYRQLTLSGDLRMITDERELDFHFKSFGSGDFNAVPLGYILSMEGADPITEIEELEQWWNLGLRVIGPVHYGRNRYSHGTGTEGGLTELGRKLLDVMAELGFLLDVTHLADGAFAEALERFSGPILASHHNCRSLVPGQRQLSDPQIRDLLERGSVIGVALDAWMLTPGWVRGRSRPEGVRIERAADHIDHICQLAGHSGNVGIGSDLDGGFGTEQCPEDLDTIRDLQKIGEILENRGYRQREIEGIFHGNWIRFFKESWSNSSKPASPQAAADS